MIDTTALVERARDGDRDALADLYQRHSGRLLACIRAQMPLALQRRVAPEDLLQETLLEGARKLGDFAPQGPSSFYRWLVGIARYKISEALRSARARKRALEEPLAVDLAASQTSPSLGAARAEGAARLGAALDALPERQGLAVRLRYLEGCSLAETAERLACSEAAVKALVARGLADLAGRLA